MTLEREAKLGVWPGFTLPDLSGIAEDVAVERLGDLHLEAAYHDTTDLRLARWGITLRHRTGDALPATEGASENGWTLKLPKSSSGSMLVRDEIVVEGDPKKVPADIIEHIVAWVRSAPLQVVARMQTERRRTVLSDTDGKPLAEIVDDEVSVLDGRHVALRFREVEVELAEGVDESLLDAVVARLRAAGAGVPDPTPKVIRALGPRALEPPELVVPKIGKEATAADVLRAGITRAVLRVLNHDVGVRLGDDAEAVHQARVGTRRLRSDLRTFGSFLDSEWSDALRAELSWFADLLGGVRDTDVLLHKLEADAGTLDPVDAQHAPGLLARLRSEREVARQALVRAMHSTRYVALLDRLVAAALDPKTLPEAAAPARDVLPRLVAAPWTALHKSVKSAGTSPADEVLHGIRIGAKRARYAADVAALVIGKPAARFAEAVAGLQEVLGDHQDACVRRTWLRDVATDLTPSAALVAGQLIAVAQADADERRAAWPKAWKLANEGRLRTWLTR